MPKMMTDVEVGEMLGLTAQTLRTWRTKGQGPRFAKLGDAVRYDEEDVKAWVEARKVEPGKPEEPLVAVELRQAAAGEPGAVWLDVNDYGAPGVDAKGVVASTLMPADDFVAWAEHTVAPMVEKVKGQMGEGVKP